MNYSNYINTGINSFDFIFGFTIIFLLIISVVCFFISVIQLIGTCKVFKKAGKNGWEAFVPFYSNWVLVEISGLNWWWFLFFFSPFICSIFGLPWLGALALLFVRFNCYYNLAKKFHKDVAFAICLTLFSPICIPILGFSKNSIYDYNISVSNNGVFSGDASNNTNNNHYNNYNYQNNDKENKGKYCGNCGTKLDETAVFCPNCGKPRF